MKYNKPCYNMSCAKSSHEHSLVFICILSVLYTFIAIIMFFACHITSQYHTFWGTYQLYQMAAVLLQFTANHCKFHCCHSSTHWIANIFIARSHALITASNLLWHHPIATVFVFRYVVCASLKTSYYYQLLLLV